MISQCILIISKWRRIQKCRQKKKAVRKRDQSKRRNCQRKWFHSFNYACHASICFFFYVDSLHCFLWFVLLAARFKLTSLSSSHILVAIQIFYLSMWNIFKIIYEKVFPSVRVSNLENVLRRKLRTDRARECIFRVFLEAKTLKIIPLSSNHGGSFVRWVCWKKLWIRHCQERKIT